MNDTQITKDKIGEAFLRRLLAEIEKTRPNQEVVARMCFVLDDAGLKTIRLSRNELSAWIYSVLLRPSQGEQSHD